MHFGLIVTINLGIGQQTPPVASVLMVASSIAKASIWEVTRVNVWFIGVLLAVLLLVTYVPVTGLGLVNSSIADGERTMTDLIDVTRDGADRDRRAQPPGEAQRADARRCGRRWARRSTRCRPTTALRCVILRGAGEKAFSPGNDIAEFATERSNKAQAIDYGRDDARDGAGARRAAGIRWSRRSTASASAAGWRSPRCATCASAAKSSRFGAPIKNLGLVMAYPEMAPLVRLAGADVALEILLEGRIFDAAEAKEKRLVTRVVPDAEVAAEARATARAHRRRRAARRALAQEVRAPARRSAAAHRGRVRRVLRLLRHRGLPDRLRGVPGQAQAGVPRPMSASGEAHPGPLAGMRVLELAQIMAGPTCGMMLADMGADVIKVEKLPGGDDSRGYREPRVNGVSAPFLMMNRNKRGIARRPQAPAGPRRSCCGMVRDADVLTENYRRGTMEKLGLGYDVLARGESRAHLLRDLRLRPRRPARRQGRLRPDRAGLRGPDVDHRRAGRPAGQDRQSRSPTSTPASSRRWASSPPTRTS